MPTSPNELLLADVTAIDGALATLRADLPAALRGITPIAPPDVADPTGTETLQALASVVTSLPLALAVNAVRISAQVDEVLERVRRADGGG